jgi:hypothetical protein
MTQNVRIFADHKEIRGRRPKGERSEPTLAQTDYRHDVLNKLCLQWCIGQIQV